MTLTPAAIKTVATTSTECQRVGAAACRGAPVTVAACRGAASRRA